MDANLGVRVANDLRQGMLRDNITMMLSHFHSGILGCTNIPDGTLMFGTLDLSTDNTEVDLLSRHSNPEADQYKSSILESGIGFFTVSFIQFPITLFILGGRIDSGARAYRCLHRTPFFSTETIDVSPTTPSVHPFLTLLASASAIAAAILDHLWLEVGPLGNCCGYVWGWL
ncbi:hypothetical protein Tco_0013475 [Tanacetum coccineum]